MQRLREFLSAVEDWILFEESIILGLIKLLFVFALFIGPLFVILYRIEQKQIAACVKRGGSWQVVGQHQSTTYIHVGEVMVPQVTNVNDYGCVEER